MPETNPEEDYVVYSVNGMRGDIDIIPLINEQIEIAMNNGYCTRLLDCEKSRSFFI